jgi:hypothetical protein
MADASSLGKFSLALYDTGRYMRLDSAAQRALNVMKSKLDANDSFSLYGLMNRARTAMGKRLLKARVWTLPMRRQADPPGWTRCACGKRDVCQCDRSAIGAPWTGDAKTPQAAGWPSVPTCRGRNGVGARCACRRPATRLAAEMQQQKDRPCGAMQRWTHGIERCGVAMMAALCTARVCRCG